MWSSSSFSSRNCQVIFTPLPLQCLSQSTWRRSKGENDQSARTHHALEGTGYCLFQKRIDWGRGRETERENDVLSQIHIVLLYYQPSNPHMIFYCRVNLRWLSLKTVKILNNKFKFEALVVMLPIFGQRVHYQSMNAVSTKKKHIFSSGAHEYVWKKDLSCPYN